VLHWSAETDAAIEQRVAAILADVRARGDAAVLEYTARFDGLQADVDGCAGADPGRLKAAFDACPAQRDALQAAAQRVRTYHERQKKACGESWSYRDADGTCWARRSRRWTAWASTCPAARRPTRPAC
jgi:histidinol dehydrogenase